jgi:hypothetical protein
MNLIEVCLIHPRYDQLRNFSVPGRRQLGLSVLNGEILVDLGIPLTAAIRGDVILAAFCDQQACLPVGIGEQWRRAGLAQSGDVSASMRTGDSGVGSSASGSKNSGSPFFGQPQGDD